VPAAFDVTVNEVDGEPVVATIHGPPELNAHGDAGLQTMPARCTELPTLSPWAARVVTVKVVVEPDVATVSETASEPAAPQPPPLPQAAYARVPPAFAATVSVIGEPTAETVHAPADPYAHVPVAEHETPARKTDWPTARPCALAVVTEIVAIGESPPL